MPVQILALILLFMLTTASHAEYYLVYQRPTAGIINLNFSASKEAHKYRPSEKQLHQSASTCGCAPDTCNIPKRDIYTAASTDCVTYENVLSGYPLP